MERIVVTGAGRGLGLEFCRQYVRRGDAVIAVTRQVRPEPGLAELRAQWPETLHIRKLDVTDFSAVERFGAELAALPVDGLINNAGQIGPELHKGEQGQSLEHLDPAVFLRLYEVNAVAPLIFAASLLPSLQLASRPRVFVLGTTVGIANQTFGGYYAYAMSKAAAHVSYAALAKELAARDILVGIICPGWVRTDLGGPLASLEAADSVRMMIEILDGFAKEQSGQFITFDGTSLAF